MCWEMLNLYLICSSVQNEWPHNGIFGIDFVVPETISKF